MRQEPVVALTYYFALFLVGPYGCLDFMTDGTIIGTQPSYSGTYVGLPWLSIFRPDSGHIGITFGAFFLMQRSDGLYCSGSIFNIWGFDWPA